jgi:hypothetical protein
MFRIVAALCSMVRVAAACGCFEGWVSIEQQVYCRRLTTHLLLSLPPLVCLPACLLACLLTVHAVGPEDTDSPAGARKAEDVVVPNVVTTTFLEIKALGICEAFHGTYGRLDSHRNVQLVVCSIACTFSSSTRKIATFNIGTLAVLVCAGSLRVYMDSHPTERFGAIYLDYCCRLGAGKFAVEMSPTADLETLFRLGLCDPRGCVLAVTLAKEDRDRDPCHDDGTATSATRGGAASSGEDAPQKLRYLVTRHAACHGLVAVVWGRRFSYGGMFVEMFYVCEPAAVHHMPCFD